ncbi:unnamed protein product [Coregonus sp. 'balchen']|nr:unnamed protein product [Coregonus sp. 'balchen']
MSPPVSTLLSGLWLCLVLSRAASSMWQACDNGKLLLGRDLPPSVAWSCPVISWPESTTQKIPSIDTKYPPQHGATVLLYHPCAPVRQRDLLSVLGHCCLSDYIITPHPDLSTYRVNKVKTRHRNVPSINGEHSIIHLQSALSWK